MPAAARAALQQHKLDVYAAVPAARGSPAPSGEVDLTRSCALVIGSEARGVSAELRAAALDVSIPTVACGIPECRGGGGHPAV